MDHHVRLWDLLRRKEVRCLTGQDGRDGSVVFAPNSAPRLRSGFKTRWGRRLACLLSGRRDACPTFETASKFDLCRFLRSQRKRLSYKEL